MSELEIIWTKVDEAPALATYSLLPILRAFAAPAGIEVAESDISVSARILAAFNDVLPDDQKVPDTLAELGRIAARVGATLQASGTVDTSGAAQLKAQVRQFAREVSEYEHAAKENRRPADGGCGSGAPA